jgi:hypothetical protein
VCTERIGHGCGCVMGVSMGGFPALQLVAAVPAIGSAVLVCGGGDAGFGYSMRSTPLWLLHGANDTVVPCVWTEELIGAVDAYARSHSSGAAGTSVSGAALRAGRLSPGSNVMVTCFEACPGPRLVSELTRTGRHRRRSTFEELYAGHDCWTPVFTGPLWAHIQNFISTDWVPQCLADAGEPEPESEPEQSRDTMSAAAAVDFDGAAEGSLALASQWTDLLHAAERNQAARVLDEHMASTRAFPIHMHSEEDRARAVAEAQHRAQDYCYHGIQ